MTRDQWILNSLSVVVMFIGGAIGVTLIYWVLSTYCQ